MSKRISGREELASFLDLAAQQEGAIRLFRPRDGSNPGLFPSSRGRYGQYQKELLGTMLVEVLSRPRMVKLTKKGVEVLLRNTPQDKRPALIARTSALYRPALVAAWKKFAVPRETEMINRSVHKHYGEMLGHEQENTSDLPCFQRKLAKELALSWSETSSAETRKRLAYFLKMVGAEPFEEEQQVVSFSGLNHKPKAPLFKGDPALVVKAGWILNGIEETPVILIKAEVTTAPS
jgi:hypothetical protein